MGQPSVEWQRAKRAACAEANLCTGCRGARHAEPGLKQCRICLDRKQVRKKALWAATRPSGFLECCQSFHRHRGDCRERRAA